MKRVRLFVSIGIVVLVAVALSSGPAAADSPATVPVGVTVGGVQVGGLGPEAALAAVQQVFQAPLELLLGTTHVLVTPDVLGASAGIDAALQQALVAPENSAIALPVTLNNQKTAAFVAGWPSATTGGRRTRSCRCATCARGCRRSGRDMSSSSAGRYATSRRRSPPVCATPSSWCSGSSVHRSRAGASAP